MMNIKTFILKYPVLSFFALTFALSWGGFVLAVGGPGGFPGDPAQIMMGLSKKSDLSAP